MKKKAGTATAIKRAGIAGFTQPGFRLDVTPIDAKETPEVNDTTSNGKAIVRSDSCQLQCRCRNPFWRGSSATAF
jgi:hypothetical protein